MTRPVLLLDDVTECSLRSFIAPKAVLRADRSEEVAPLLLALEAARAAGNYVAGYFSYELGYVLEPKLLARLPDGRRGPLAWFGVFDAPEVLSGEAASGALIAWQQGRAYAGPLTPEWDETAYRARFDRVKAYIAAGDIYQANLSFRSRFAFQGDPLALYAGLRQAAGARYGAYVEDGERHILSLSPELFFDLSADGVLTAKPMKGTAGRGADPAADARAQEALAQSPKDRAENLMIVDLLRNDLGRIAETGSVSVPSLFAVETYPTLHQMVSTITAKLKPEQGAAEVVKALFPCGSITGAPKIRAQEVLAELEESSRGVYCGAIGYFAPDGSARFNVAIRTMTISGGRGELGIGGGVVQDSRGEDEYAEALLKARYFTQGRKPLELIETLRWSKAEGFVRLERHFARMARSAAALGLSFDPSRAQDVLDEATYALALPEQDAVAHRLRLTLDEAGEIGCTTGRLGPAKEHWRCTISPTRLQSTDLLARHKTNWRAHYESAFSAQCPPFDEVIFLNEKGEVVEASRTNIFVERDGVLLTPPLSSGCLPGILREELLDTDRAREALLTPEDLEGGFYLGNSLRGLIRASL
ncbi:para-aminobenzoate synthetase/4-amino-4-deoxychorismate lyase [Rhizomicrobium palustre]|uniref:Probable branched-chain-amino-acid aminotransferase n=1 Tax=Rhizomicrobium palustre TaxID=189966 RepID=A0A846MUJ8_9PROT|nr:aminodeoxychorismate synthase component I [Rhizomicrobium palustre]NIK86687.1 para-aminobenzoate synthetase/4-amino-4-deoxychorismate lyase [Rhizomicrobium palustre]